MHMEEFSPHDLTKSNVYIIDPIVVKKPWGLRGTFFSQLTHVRTQDQDFYGELWTASAQAGEPNQANRVRNYGNGLMTLHELLLRERHRFLGKQFSHLFDQRPKRGKTESWYIREVHGIVKIITGIKKDMTKTRFSALVRAGYFNQQLTLAQLERDLVMTELARIGETYIVKPGTLHTIWPVDDAYCVIDEVQEGFGTSLLPTLSKALVIRDALSLQVHPHDHHVRQETRPDIAKLYNTEPTIRVSDFGRGRPIQPELAVDLIDYGHVSCSRTAPLIEHVGDKAMLTHLLANKYFAKDRLQIAQAGSVTFSTNDKQYYVMHIIQGSVSICTQTGLFDARAGQTVAIPAYLGVYTIEAYESSELLVDFVPDLHELVNRLEDRGYSPEEICKLDGDCFENDIKQEYVKRQVVV